MKQTLAASVVLPRSRPGDRVIRVSRRRGKVAGFLNSITALLRFGSSPKAR